MKGRTQTVCLGHIGDEILSSLCEDSNKPLYKGPALWRDDPNLRRKSSNSIESSQRSLFFQAACRDMSNPDHENESTFQGLEDFQMT